MNPILQYMRKNDFGGVLVYKDKALVANPERVTKLIREMVHFMSNDCTAEDTLEKFENEPETELVKVTHEKFLQIGQDIRTILENLVPEHILVILTFDINGEEHNAIFKPAEEHFNDNMRFFLEAVHSDKGVHLLATHAFAENAKKGFEIYEKKLIEHNLSAIFLNCESCLMLNPKCMSIEMLHIGFFNQNILQHPDADTDLMWDAALDRANKVFTPTRPASKIPPQDLPNGIIAAMAKYGGTAALVVIGTDGDSEVSLSLSEAYPTFWTRRFTSMVRALEAFDD